MDASSPSVTLADIEAAIVSERYFTAAEGVQGAYQARGGVHPHGVSPSHEEHQTLGLLTFCVLVLDNGIKAVGTSACVNPAIFDEQKGRDYARKQALDQVWPLLGMRLADLRHRQAEAERVVAAMDAEDAALR
jgi:hypothetical protein